MNSLFCIFIGSCHFAQ